MMFKNDKYEAELRKRKEKLNKNNYSTSVADKDRKIIDLSIKEALIKIEIEVRITN